MLTDDNRYKNKSAKSGFDNHCRECRKKLSRNSTHRPTEEQKKRYKELDKQRRAENPDEYIRWQRAKNMKIRDKVTHGYAAAQMKLHVADLPPELLEVKRLTIQLWRALR